MEYLRRRASWWGRASPPHVAAIVNPVSGKGSAQRLMEAQVLPLLRDVAGLRVTVHVTQVRGVGAGEDGERARGLRGGLVVCQTMPETCGLRPHVHTWALATATVYGNCAKRHAVELKHTALDAAGSVCGPRSSLSLLRSRHLLLPRCTGSHARGGAGSRPEPQLR